MTDPHLNTPQVSTSPTFERSQDFLNIDEPPCAQETPSVSTFNLPDPSAPAQSVDKPVPMIRRRSTNYMDALNSREQARERESSIGEHAPGAERRSSGPMDFQNTIHNMQYRTTNDSDLSHAGVDMGDSISHTPICSRAGNRPIFKNSYLDNNSNGNSARVPHGSPPQLGTRRKSSFKYEDFKKDIYNQLHMFGEK
ncbi:CRB_1a_G0017300.mRNA.1.CDS.1 [Saccharomyces cerevisiae]|nr:CRB_1a_G0017300.mRNA.1.CDS.1 [Saccharomyces cerevisiae]CAI7277936.1 CRB_1a_G0017300.mRNA.1.CDS.1 [Saccharomyces cerevisiae]